MLELAARLAHDSTKFECDGLKMRIDPATAGRLQRAE
jgi:hypothetical protein